VQNPFQQFADWLTFTVLGMVPGTPPAVTVNFFVFDILVISLTMVVVVFLVSLISSFVTPQKIKALLEGRSEGTGNVIAALIGVPTPFCSCSVVPFFIGAVEAGVPLGISFSFLIASPLVNKVAIAMLLAMFGWQIALMYIISGLIISVIAGIIIGRLHLEHEIEDFVFTAKIPLPEEKGMDWRERITFALSESRNTLVTVFPFILLGIGTGAILYGYIPAEFLVNVVGKDNPFAVPLVVLIGIPLYANAAALFPIVSVLTAKGMETGTVLGFMMAVIGLSPPQMIILRKFIKIKLLLVFTATLFIAFTLTGYLFNALLGL
jgi:uncharacterized membrane protein YraQ (UPF0718 family)